MGRENDARALPPKRPRGSNSSETKADFLAPKTAERNGALASFQHSWAGWIIQAEEFLRPSPPKCDRIERSRCEPPGQLDSSRSEQRGK